jgi:hypothetical protein
VSKKENNENTGNQSILDLQEKRDPRVNCCPQKKRPTGKYRDS